MVHTLQLTLGATPTRLTSADVPVLQLIFQNNAAHSIRVGDHLTSATRGVLLASGSPGGSINIGPFIAFNTNLCEWWIAGTSGDVIDVLYIQ